MVHHKPQHTPELHEVADQWHHHEAAEGMPQKEHGPRVNTVVLTGVFLAIVIVITGTIAAAILYFNQHITVLRQHEIETTVLAAEANEYRAAAEASFATYTWVDAEKGVVQLPLGVARERVLARYAGKR